MKATTLTLCAVLLGGLATIGGTGCGATYTATARTPAVAVTVVRPVPPPARVYYSGRWLHYRGTAYHYYDGGHWVVARSVPTHVVHHHRPVHVSRTYVAPTHVRRSPTHVTRTSRTRRPVHVRRKADTRLDKSPILMLNLKDLA